MWVTNNMPIGYSVPLTVHTFCDVTPPKAIGRGQAPGTDHEPCHALLTGLKAIGRGQTSDALSRFIVALSLEAVLAGGMMEVHACCLSPHTSTDQHTSRRLATSVNQLLITVPPSVH
jgi:hypothetical protein